MNFNANPEVNARRASRAKPLSLSVGNNSSKFNPGAAPTSHPPLPARSPLRPTPRTDSAATTPHSPPHTWMFRNQNLPSSPVLLPLLSNSRSVQRPSPSTTSFSRPESPPTLPSLTDEVSSLSLTLVDDQPEPIVTTKIPKRTHALLELLSSERAYASDLAFIRDTHIPMALGKPPSFHPPPDTPPSSSSSSGRAVSVSSDSSGSSVMPPMTREDTRVIFGNIAELAVFSDTFCERLEEALGCIVEEGKREDHVGELFLEIIPLLEPPYTAYITRHSAALEHLSSLPQSPALSAYLAESRRLAASITHAWDLPSLLIKPVQRLLKYPLLLSAIIEETADNHPDKDNLKLAKKKLEEVAASVNEGRRRRELVKEVLTKSSGDGLRKKVAAVGAATTANLHRIGSLKRYQAKEENEEGMRVEQMKKRLQECIRFIREFYKETLQWSKSVAVLKGCLRNWALSFSRVIGLAENSQSEAFDAFLYVLEQQLLPLCQNLDEVVRNKLLLDLTMLLNSARAPLRLLDVMASFEPLHYGLLNINISKTRPAPALLEASQSYVALRGQLHSELPQYLELLENGLATCIIQLSAIQIEFWAVVRERWSDLWDALRVDGELNAGADETESVWRGRWSEVEGALNSLFVINPQRVNLDVQVPPQYLMIPAPAPLRSDAVMNMLTSLDPPPQSPSPTRSPAIVNMLSALEPSRQIKFLPDELVQTQRKPSQDTQSIKRGRWGNWSKRRSTDSKEWDVETAVSAGVIELPPSPSRTWSAPSGLNSAPPQLALIPQAQFDPPSRGGNTQRSRSPPKPSLRRKLSETLRPLRNRSPSPRSFSFADQNLVGELELHYPPNTPNGRMVWQRLPAKYACRVVHPCAPPPGTAYRDMPFFMLEVNQKYDVLQEFGHPSTHADLPLYVDDGEDCLLLVRDEQRRVGWALASFLMPLD